MRQMSLWYGKDNAIFGSLDKEHPRIEVVKVPGGYVCEYVEHVRCVDNCYRNYCFVV